MADLPPTHKALVLTSKSTPPAIQDLPTPKPVPGSAVVRVHATNIVHYMPQIYNGTRQNYPLSLPLTIGTSAVGRIAALGPDSTFLKIDQLVWIDSFIHSRDNPSDAFLLGIHAGGTEQSKILMDGEWRHATFAEYAKIPLENLHPLDESRLLADGFGYEIPELTAIGRLAVAYGGLNSISLKAGETIIVAPATGPFGLAAVNVALAMGARVLAMGRNVQVLENLKAQNSRVEIIPLTNDPAVDLPALQNYGNIDAYFDISPPEAAESTHIKSCILALKQGGRISFMSGIRGDVEIPMTVVVHRNLEFKGKWMYDRKDVGELIGMVELGLLGLWKGVKTFGLEEWEKGFEGAQETGKSVIAP